MRIGSSKKYNGIFLILVVALGSPTILRELSTRIYLTIFRVSHPVFRRKAQYYSNGPDPNTNKHYVQTHVQILLSMTHRFNLFLLIN